MSCAILILLFVFQRLGTSKLGHLFAPVILLWFFANFCIGIYNIVIWHPGMPSHLMRMERGVIVPLPAFAQAYAVS